MDSRKPNHDTDLDRDPDNHHSRHHHHHHHSSRTGGDHDDSSGGLDHTEDDDEEEEEWEGGDDEEEEGEEENGEGQGRGQQDEVRELAMVALCLLKQEVKVMMQQVKQLVKANSQLASQVFTTDVDGWTPIHACTLRGKKKVLKAMLRSGIDVNVRMGQPEGLPAGCTLLHIAANRQDKKVVDYLLHHGAQVNAGDSFGRTALFYANRSGNKDAAKLLVENGGKFENVGDTATTTAMTPPDVRVEEVRTSLSDDLVLETPEPKLSRFCFLPLPQHHHRHRGKRSSGHHRQNRQQQEQQQQQQRRGQALHVQSNSTNGHRTS